MCVCVDACMRTSVDVDNRVPSCRSYMVLVGSVQVGVSHELINGSVILLLKHRKPGRASSQQMKGRRSGAPWRYREASK